MNRQVLAAWKEASEDSHPEILISMNNLGSTLQEAEKLQEAEQIQKEVVAAHRAALGNSYPDTLLSMNNLGITLEIAGKLGEAEKYRKRLWLLKKEH